VLAQVSTGCAACGKAAAPLHPWLHSDAPPGLRSGACARSLSAARRSYHAVRNAGTGPTDALSPRQGRRTVATGGAQRNPWKEDPRRSPLTVFPARKGQRNAWNRTRRSATKRKSSAPAGAGAFARVGFHGLRGARRSTARPLHPWLYSDAPSGLGSGACATRPFVACAAGVIATPAVRGTGSTEGPSSRQGRRNVATGGAQRNPWKEDARTSPLTAFRSTATEENQPRHPSHRERGRGLGDDGEGGGIDAR
jgi:hypothetical protein